MADDDFDRSLARVIEREYWRAALPASERPSRASQLADCSW
jgi:hypothetical protein